jgi:uroporphyrinogen decarboxylase
MIKAKRIKAVLAGEPVDRLPFSFWYHFYDIPVEERSGEKLAEAELDFYRMYDPDFLKVMHDIPYDLPEGMKQIDTLEQWKQLAVIDPAEGNFGKQLKAIRLIVEALGPEVPVIDTVFNPFAYAQKLTNHRALQLFHENPQVFHEGMAKITETLSCWAEAIIEVGAAGIYLAIQDAAAASMTEQEYSYEFLPYDRQILSKVQDSAILNIVHIHGTDIYWNIWRNLPFQALSWSSNLTPPSFAEARKEYSSCLVGGVDETKIGGFAPEQVEAQIRTALAEAGGKGLIVAPGCAVPTDTPPENLKVFKKVVSAVKTSEAN